MASRKKAKPAGTRIEAMPWQDFAIAFEIANSALAHFTRPALRPPFRQPEASAGRSSPFLGVAFSLRRHFGPDYPHLDDFLHRYQALMALVEGGLVEAWVFPGDEDHPRRLHPALLLAAAEVRLTRNARFPSKRFAARVVEIIRTESGPPDAEGAAPAAGGPATDPHGEARAAERDRAPAKRSRRNDPDEQENTS